MVSKETIQGLFTIDACVRLHEIPTFGHVAQLWQLSTRCNGTRRDCMNGSIHFNSCTVFDEMLVSAILLVFLLAPPSFEGKNNQRKEYNSVYLIYICFESHLKPAKLRLTDFNEIVPRKCVNVDHKVANSADS